jgi:AcrR family transcriptional regulator
LKSSSKKEKILTSAAELFAMHGFYKVSVREICEKAEVTKPSLYYYYKDKEALLEELMNETNKCADKLVEKYVGQKTQLHEILNGIIEVYLEFLRKYPHLTRFSAFIQATNVPPKILKMKKQRYKNEMERFVYLLKEKQDEGIISEILDTKLLANNFIGTILMIIWEHLLFNNDLLELEQKFRNFVEFWIKTFLVTESPE